MAVGAGVAGIPSADGGRSLRPPDSRLEGWGRRFRACILADLDQLLAAAKLLISGQLGYQDAGARHFARLLRV